MSDAAARPDRGLAPQSASDEAVEDQRLFAARSAAAAKEKAAREEPTGLAGFLSKLNGLLFGSREDPDVKDTIEDILEEEEAEEELSPKERLMLRNLLKFGELTADELMVPRADIVAVEEGASLAETLKAFDESQHSRLPVYRESLDDPRGMVHIKDIVAHLVKGDRAGPFGLAGVMRPVLFVSPTTPAIDILLKMQARRQHLALVVDEYGGTDGLLSIEDLVEQIVGDIEDEHDTDDEPDLTLQPDGGFEADARASLEDVEKAAGLTLADADERDEIDTLGGLVAAVAGRVPAVGETIRHRTGVEFEILDADPRRIKRVRVRRPPEASADVETT